MNSIALSYFTITTALTSLGFQLVLTAKLHELTGSGLKAQSIALATFLFGLAIGGYIFEDSKSIKKQDSRFLLFSTELAVSIIGLISLPIISILLSRKLLFSPLNVSMDTFHIYAYCLPFILCLGLVSGLQLPTILQKYSKRENKILFLNYFGALFAGPIINYFLDLSLPLYLHTIAFGILNISNLIILSYSRKSKFWFFSSIIPALLIFSVIKIYPVIKDVEKSTFYFGHRMNSNNTLSELLSVTENYGSIKTITTPYQVIDLVSDPPNKDSFFSGDMTLYLNRRPQFNLHSQTIYHDSMVVGAFNLYKLIPKNILILGAGDGLLLNKILNYTEVEKVTLVELDSQVINLSRTDRTLSNLNQNVFDRTDPRVTTLIQDAISFLRNDKHKYDAIFIDFPFPFEKELLKLFSFEFYSMVKSRLYPYGFITMDFPSFDQESSHKRLSSRIKNSLFKAGFKNQLAYGSNAPFLYAEQTMSKKLAFDYEKMPKDLNLGSLRNLISIEYLFKENTLDNGYISLFLNKDAK